MDFMVIYYIQSRLYASIQE